MDKTFLQFVRAELAKRRPASFVEIANATDLPVSTIRKVHYGEIKNPGVDTVQRLYDHFKGVSPRSSEAA